MQAKMEFSDAHVLAVAKKVEALLMPKLIAAIEEHSQTDLR